MMRRFAAPLAFLGLLGVSSAQAIEAMPQDKSAPATDGKSLRHAVEGINAFSLDLYKREIRPGQNLLLSPASVSIAVGLAYRGAVGKTAGELDRALHFNARPADYLRAEDKLLAAMNFAGDGRRLETANALWIQTGLLLKPDFAADIAGYAGAGVEHADFRQNPDGARRVINHWVETQTHDKIRNLLHEGDVMDSTRAVLVNAIYWKAKWAAPFDKAATKPGPFTMDDGRQITTGLMHLDDGRFSVLERHGIKGIFLPYQGREVAMMVLLPNASDGLAKFERELTYSDLERWLIDLQDAAARPTAVTLPKFHLDWRGHLEGDIAAMGAPTAFSGDADFSGITGQRDLTIGAVVHQVTIDVDEEGTEAAAATATGIVVSGRRMPSPPPFIFRADHSFLFALVDKRTGMILFIGRYAGPPVAR